LLYFTVVMLLTCRVVVRWHCLSLGHLPPGSCRRRLCQYVGCCRRWAVSICTVYLQHLALPICPSSYAWLMAAHSDWFMIMTIPNFMQVQNT